VNGPTPTARMVTVDGIRLETLEIPASRPDPAPPLVPLSREEQLAVTSFADRAPSWSPQRQQELAAHARSLTRSDGSESVHRLMQMALWLRGGGA